MGRRQMHAQGSFPPFQELMSCMTTARQQGIQMLNHYKICTMLFKLLPRRVRNQAPFPCLSVSFSHGVC
ncbi:hypothetical protein Nmel_009310, partial [Mimus melanotis]